MLDNMWKHLQQQLHDLKLVDDDIYKATERSETASGHPAYTLATAPLLANGAKAGDEIWISDGRKTGEGAGVGTGVLAYYNPSTNSYFRPADDTAVVV